MKVLVLILLTIGLASTTAKASGNGVLTYICIEERSVGWETRENGELYIGKFKPSDGKFMVRFMPHKWAKLVNEQRYLILPQIEVTKDGETYTYQSAVCDFHQRGSGLPRYSAQELEMQCEALLGDGIFRNYFGRQQLNYRFSEPLSEKPKSTTYTSAANGGWTVAYVNGGTCVLDE